MPQSAMRSLLRDSTRMVLVYDISNLERCGP